MILRLLDKVSLGMLVGIASVGGGLCSVVALVMHNRTQDKMRNSDIYKEGLKIVAEHKHLQNALGIPIKLGSVKLRRPTDKNSTFYDWHIPVVGQKETGMLYFKTANLNNENENNICIAQVEIYFDSNKKRFVIYKSS